MINCIVIDDEITSRLALTEALKGHKDMINVIAEANSVATAVQLINEKKPDIIFLDIELGDGTGFDVLAQTDWNNYCTVFVTAYNQYAIKAFRNNAVDYLLKPINAEELAETVEKLNDIYEPNSIAQIQLLLNDFKNKSFNNRIGFSTSEGISFYDIQQIIRCESSSNYSTIFFEGEEKLLLAKTLKDLEVKFSGYGFQRVHHSHLINMRHVKKYNVKDGGSLLLKDGTSIPVSHRKKTQIIELLQSMTI